MAGDHQGQGPIACSLTPVEMVDRGSAWGKLLRSSLISRERVPGGLRLVVHQGAVESLRSLANLERECCPWINFNFEGNAVVVTAAGAGEDALVEMFSESWARDRST
jgi:hypothetical protein